jgi:hypothetical protein
MMSEFTVCVTKFQNKSDSGCTDTDLDLDIFPGLKNAIFQEFKPVYNRTNAIKQMLLFFKHELMLYKTYIIYNDNCDGNDIVIKNREQFLNIIHMYTASASGTASALNQPKHVSFTYTNTCNETVKFDIYEKVIEQSM